jgi:uncharacterized protein with FMN-binding domain
MKEAQMTDEAPKRPNTPPSRRQGAAPPSPTTAKAKGGGKNKKIANGLVALGSAAILSVYGLGYVRTDAAQALYNLDAPTISIATAAPTTTTVPPSSVAAYQSPLFPTPTTVTSDSDGSAQAVTTATTDESTATTPAATASASTTSAQAQSPATATTAPPTATTAPLPRANTAAATATSAPAATATKIPATATATKSAATSSLYKDGTYSGTGTSRHGNISASVVIQGGKIVSAAITQCGTRYPCSDIAALPGEVVAQQSAAVDFVSGATDSSQAYRGAIQNALAKAKAAA